MHSRELEAGMIPKGTRARITKKYSRIIQGGKDTHMRMKKRDTASSRFLN